MITKSALVDQAFALAKYEIDTPEQYDAVYGAPPSFSGLAVEGPKRDRIVRHHQKILAAKRANKPSGPSPQLVAGLRQLYGEAESLELFALLQSVMEHAGWKDGNPTLGEENDEGSKHGDTDTRKSNAYSIEALIGNLCQAEEDGSGKLHGLLISLLLMVTAYQVTDTGKSESKEQPDPSSPPPLQVGSILSVVRPQDEDHHPWRLEADFLTYLGDAAALYEERIEIQKECLLSRLDDAVTLRGEKTPQPTTGTTGVVSPAMLDSPSDTPQLSATPDVAPGEHASSVRDNIEAAAAALSAAVFESIISSAASHQEISSDDDVEGAEDDDSSGSDPDSDYEGEDGLDENASSSSSSESEDEEGGLLSPHVESGEDHVGGSLDEDTALRHAFALSLSEPEQALRVDTVVSELHEAPQSPAWTPGPVSPGAETPISKTPHTPTGDSQENSLPAMPPHPKVYPYGTLLHTELDSDHQVDTASSYYDPGVLNRFGILPASHVLIHVLRYTLEGMERQKFRHHDAKSQQGREHEVSKLTVVGGMCASLFPPRHHTVNSACSSLDEAKEVGMTLQMLISLFLLIHGRRNDAVDNLKTAMAQENLAEDGEGDEMERDGHGHVSSDSEEGDDPAIALALHYLDEEAESKESLEAKGMHRKAAAAAQDAAAVLKSLRRRTESWKEQVRLFSHCALLSMQCLQTFLQSVVRQWLQDRHSLSVTDVHGLVPKTLVAKLSEALESVAVSSTTASDPKYALRDDKLHKIFLSLKLYQSAILLWGEIFPIVNPTVLMQSEVLRTRLVACTKHRSGVPYSSLEKISSTSLSEIETSFHRLHALCRRLRVSDLLDRLVSRPISFVPSEDSVEETHRSVYPTGEPQRSSALVGFITSLSRDCGGLSGELLNLYLAICHRNHVRVILWDGLYALSDSEMDEIAPTLAASSSDNVRVSTQPSDSLALDGTKCSDSMSIVPNTGEDAKGSSAHQRASKVWGTVLSSLSFSPKTGIHRWAVRLDKCERGHVFVGVATAQATTRTYVGGDKYGWGMIGTQALWHDRRKIRGDYGATFRTGSTIIVTLDTDAGTLSFSSWKESSSSSLDSAVQNVGSSRRQMSLVGSVEDWGVAFEGLPLDSRLFPAVGLYQRDDRVTLLTVESGLAGLAGREGASDLLGGLCYFPRVSDVVGTQDSRLTTVKRFNDLLSWDGVEYAVSTLADIVRSMQDGIDDAIFGTLLPCLASALCLAPTTIPFLSQRSALRVLPHLTKCLQELEKLNVNPEHLAALFPRGLHEGKWLIRATGTSSADPEEYIVDIGPAAGGSVFGFEGSGVGTTGRSKNGLVSIFGNVKGSSVHFVEEWSEDPDDTFGTLTSDDVSSTCVISARLGLDGKKFEGHYRNIQFGTIGQIAGLFLADDRKVIKFRLPDVPGQKKHHDAYTEAISTCTALLALAHSHLASILCEDIAVEMSMAPLNYSGEHDFESRQRRLEIKGSLAIPFLAKSRRLENEEGLPSIISVLRQLYGAPNGVPLTIDSDSVDILEAGQQLFTVQSQNRKPDDCPPHESDLVDIGVVDLEIRETLRGMSSFSTLSELEYGNARKHIIAVIVRFCGLGLADLRGASGVSSDARNVWIAAQNILESGLRRALGRRIPELSSRETARDMCLLYVEISKFLLSLESETRSGWTVDDIVPEISELYRIVQTDTDLLFLTKEVDRSTNRGVMRLIAISETLSLLGQYTIGEVCTPALEALLTGLPRLLGRGLVCTHPASSYRADIEQLDGHYLHDLPGVSARVCRELRGVAHGVWSKLCDLLARLITARTGNRREPAMVDSMMLAIFASFTTSMNKEDLRFVLDETRLLRVAEEVMEIHRVETVTVQQFTQIGLSTHDMTVVDVLDDIGNKEISRSIVRSILGMSHVLIYQTMASFGENSDYVDRVLCFARVEFEKIIPDVENAVQLSLNSDRQKIGDDQWKLWLEICCNGSLVKTPSARLERAHLQNGRSGVEYLLENGMSHLKMSHGTTPKSQSGARSSHANETKNHREPTVFRHGFCLHVLSHWLHVLMAAARCRAGIGCVSGSAAWMEFLFAFTGLDAAAKNRRPELIPGRYRARVIRALLSFLECQSPSETIVAELFRLAGRNSLMPSCNIYSKGSDVSREAVSLLRQLHSSRRMPWRTSINGVVSRLNVTIADFDLKLGVALFFNGGAGTVSQGAYVILRPPAAAPLAAEHQAGSSGKGVSQGGGVPTCSLPHHVVGSGTEGIVSGLCRADASAGIVSTVDLKNRLCEVILVNRDYKRPHQTIRKKTNVNALGRSTSSRHTLTVRAVRSPLSEVAHAQEVGLSLGDDTMFSDVMICLMKEALEIHARLLQHGPSSDDDEGDRRNEDLTTIQDEMSQSCFCITVLKGALSVLSDDILLNSFLQNKASRDVLSKILQVHGSEQVRAIDQISSHSPPMSSLPIHEARWWLVVDLIRNLQVRVEVLDETPNSQWSERFEDYKTLVVSSPPSASSDLGTTTSLGGYATPPVDPGTESSATHSGQSLSSIIEGNTSQRQQGNFTSNEAPDSQSQTQAMASSDNSDDDSEAASGAASQLREAAIAHMAELGLPRSWSEFALRRTGGVNIEAAVHFCLERGGEMERLLLEESERERISQRTSGSSGRRRGNRRDSSGHLLRQLMEMGFPSRWCAEALAATGNNVDEALTWILSNVERLSSEDAGMEEGEADDDDDEDDHVIDEDDHEEVVLKEMKNDPEGPSTGSAPNLATRPAWTGSIIPLRFISGRSIIDSKTLSVSGLPTGGFSSVGTRGVLLTSGKWYYEAILETAGCLQIGWADGSFAGHCHADRGDGCGDGPSSWAYDGWRRYRWHSTATEWGCRWKEGDVVGCMVDMDEMVISFTLNGRAGDIGMGVAFSGSGFRPCGGVYACVSFNRKEKLRMILGGGGSEPFKHPPPPGYQGVGEAVLMAVRERDYLVSKEQILDSLFTEQELVKDAEKRFICDFSDGEHGHELMAWAHRYYGSDASVHLGSSRNKAIGVSKAGIASAGQDSSSWLHLDERIQEAWSSSRNTTIDSTLENKDLVVAEIRTGYLDVARKIKLQNLAECSELASLYSRKLILHVIVTMGTDFNPECFLGTNGSTEALQFWKLIEASSSLRSAGWIGEAGAMALAAEALGLGISSNDGLSERSSTGSRKVPAQSSDSDHECGLPAAGLVQVLSPVVEIDLADRTSRCTSRSFVASAEASIGSESGGGVLVFLRKGLIGSLQHSCEIRDIAMASVRRTIRLLAAVEYDGEASSSIEEGKVEDAATDSKPSKSDVSAENSVHADARLASYVTGLLLCIDMDETSVDRNLIRTALFEAWSVGMLSASLPWRMVCAFTAAGILNSHPMALLPVIQNYPTLCRFYGRLPSTVARRIWAERAASPICSRYTQAMMELLCSVKRSIGTFNPTEGFLKYWRDTAVDAATPRPLSEQLSPTGESTASSWETEECWISSDDGYEILIGSVNIRAVDWKAPTRSAVRTLMDGGDGPPMLSEGCLVVRGLDWVDTPGNGDDDGKKAYEKEKAARDAEKETSDERGEETVQKEIGDDPIDYGASEAQETTEKQSDATEKPISDPADESAEPLDETEKKGKRKRTPGPKLPIGTVVSIEPWNGVPAMARRVRWHRTGIEGVYRFGGDGGRYDVCHVEVNEKSTRVKKRHPLPESSEQCAARHAFGMEKLHNVLLRLKKSSIKQSNDDGTTDFVREGVLELPDFGAGILVRWTDRHDGTVSLTEIDLLFGSKDSGWEARFGQPSYIPGTTVILSLAESSEQVNQAELDARSPFMSLYEVIRGSSTYNVVDLKNRDDGKGICVTSDVCLMRAKRYSMLDESVAMSPSIPPPLNLDRDYHAPSLSLSRDGRTVSCLSSDGRGTAYGSIGFTKGVHYWEVKLEQADIGSVFIGVAEKPSGSGSGSSMGYEMPRLNRWHGWGFVNFRATYTAGAERIYGAHCHAGDTVGVLLDCDAGRLSFFFDGLKYGEHILNDLGCAFENLSPFGFNVDGCGSGGFGQGAPAAVEGGRAGRYPAQGAVRPKALWPVIGLRNQGDRVTISPKWISSYGCDGVTVMKNATKVDEILEIYSRSHCSGHPGTRDDCFPKWFVQEAFTEYQRWKKGSWVRASTRGSGPFQVAAGGLNIDLDCSPLACACASALLGLRYALLHGDRVRLKRSAGRILELAEEALVLGTHHGRLYYRIVSQKSEGGSLTEGGGRAWFWDESEVVDGISVIGEAKGRGIPLPLMDRFRCLSSGGLKVVYEGGAVVRSDLEIFEGSMNLGSIPADSILDQKSVMERRVNSCGVVRYRVRFNDLEGWISSNIRGGNEDSIVMPVDSTIEDPNSTRIKSYPTPMHCASEWIDAFNKSYDDCEPASEIGTLESFEQLLKKGLLDDRTMAESDFVVTKSIGLICDHCQGGNPFDVVFDELASAVSFGAAATSGDTLAKTTGSTGANQVAGEAFSLLGCNLPPVEAILARVALLRVLNRRAKYALPWLSLKPSQEGSAILGGIYGHGASADRAGRSTNTSLLAQWAQVPTIGANLRSLRGLFFASVKKEFVRSITDATTTPTPLSHDEYELPREIRTVRLNRLKARRVMDGNDSAMKKKHSVFGQLQNETKNWGGAALRRGYVAKGHGGQRRAFKVKLIGEGVNDYSGPYRETFTDSLAELLSVDEGGGGSLGVLDPTPNCSADIGENRGLYMFSLNGCDISELSNTTNTLTQEERSLRESFFSLTVPRDEASREVEEALVFLGRIVGTAFRHGIPLDLPLPLESVWKAIAEERSDWDGRLAELDILAHRHETQKDFPHFLVLWQQRMLNAFVEGLSNVLPVEVLPLLTGEELRDMFCGNPDVDVDLLQRVVEYEGYEATDEVVRYFWDTLREFTNVERKAFLQFVWARNRLPMKESDFEAPFKLQKDTLKKDGDKALPTASTCFFSLSLPAYSTKEVLKEKLLFAIQNVTTMETDFQTNSAEIAEGYRAL